MVDFGPQRLVLQRFLPLERGHDRRRKLLIPPRERRCPNLQFEHERTRAADALGSLLGRELLRPARDRSAQRDDAIMDVDVDLARVDGRVPEQLLLDVLLERCVGFHIGLPSGRGDD